MTLPRSDRTRHTHSGSGRSLQDNIGCQSASNRDPRSASNRDPFVSKVLNRSRGVKNRSRTSPTGADPFRRRGRVLRKTRRRAGRVPRRNGTAVHRHAPADLADPASRHRRGSRRYGGIRVLREGIRHHRGGAAGRRRRSAFDFVSRLSASTSQHNLLQDRIEAPSLDRVR